MNLDTFSNPNEDCSQTSSWKTNGACNQVSSILSASEAREKVTADIPCVIKLIKARSEWKYNLIRGVKEDWEERLVLDGLLDAMGLEKNDESRYAAYIRFYSMYEDNFRTLLEKNGISKAEIAEKLEQAFIFIAQIEMEWMEKIIRSIQQKELLTPFYREIIASAHTIGKAFNAWHIAWNKKLVNGVNQRLENRLGSQEAIMKYLSDNQLFDKGHGGEIADRSYSMLQEKEDSYEKLSYIQAFPEEISNIVAGLENAIAKLVYLEDIAYEQKAEYIAYFRSLITAFSETNTDALVEKWAKVDEAWMKISGPIQILHPLEFYEDMFRKAVAPEWEVRVTDNRLFDSKIDAAMKPMFESVAEKIGLSSDSEVYKFSNSSLRRVQLHLCEPLTYYGARLVGLPSAQVVPNDDLVSKMHGKKIFSFARNILSQMRNRPKTKFTELAFDADFYKKRDALVFGEDADFYKIYDISTLGHEYGHTLWCDADTESRMNESGNFKNIEEWKATTGGLMAFFQQSDPSLQEPLLVEHAFRTVRLLSAMKIDDTRTYYIESLIHLKILFESGLLYQNSEGKTAFQLTPEIYEKIVSLYSEYYEKIARLYAQKDDAGKFLNDYVVIENGCYLPKDASLRAYTLHIYELFKDFGNVLA